MRLLQNLPHSIITYYFDITPYAIVINKFTPRFATFYIIILRFQRVVKTGYIIGWLTKNRPHLWSRNLIRVAVPAAVVHIHAVELAIPGHERFLVALAGWLWQVLVGTYNDCPHGLWWAMMGHDGPWTMVCELTGDSNWVLYALENWVSMALK